MKTMRVYKSSVAKVKAPLPVPTMCPNCGAGVELVNNSAIYGKEFGAWPFAYRCISKDCDSYVGVHPKTDIPIGVMANKTVRAARKQAKAAFSPMWEVQGISKDAAYAWLAEKMGIANPNQCHIGWMDVADCSRVIDICNANRKVKP